MVKKTLISCMALVFVSLLIVCSKNSAQSGVSPDVTGCNSSGDKKQSPCANMAFTVDAATLALYHFNETGGMTLVDETGKWNGTLEGGTRATGAFGSGLSFAQGQYAKFDTIIPDGTPEGTLELYFLSKSGFDTTASYLIFGTDGSRCNLFYNKGSLVFMKNHSDIFKYVTAKVPLQQNRWYHVAGTWGSAGMRLFLDCVQLSSNQDTSCYESSPRTSLENIFYIGKKSWCCMEDIGISQDIGYCGDVDEVRISDIDRYSEAEAPADIDTAVYTDDHGKKIRHWVHRHHKNRRFGHDTSSGTSSNPCANKPFAADAYTLALYHADETSGNVLLDATTHWNGLLGSGVRSSGVFNGGLSYTPGQYSTFDTIIPDGTPNGTVEGYFCFNPGYDSTAAYAIFGNNGARCNLLYKNGTLIFQKNYSNIFKQVVGKVSLKPNQWYHVAGTWGTTGMRLYLDCIPIASNQDYSAYQSSPRGKSENAFYIGWKAYDGMEGVGIYSTIYLNGKVDEIRISNIDRYSDVTVFAGNAPPTGSGCTAFPLDNGTVFLANFNNNLNDAVTGSAGTLTAGSFVNSLFCNGIKLDNAGTEKAIYRFSETQQLILSRGTMEALVYAENVTSDFTHIIDKSWQYGITAYNGFLAVHFGHWWYSSVPLPLKKWSYIAGSYDGTTIRLYLNGVCVDSSSYQGNGTSSYDLGIGNASASSHNVPFIGTIDEVRISNAVRTADEIANSWKAIEKKIR